MKSHYHLIFVRSSRIVLCIITILLFIIIIFPSLNKLIPGSQVQVPQFTGGPVLWTVRLDTSTHGFTGLWWTIS